MLLFFDTETTSLDIKHGQICQLSYIMADTQNKSVTAKNFYFTVESMDPGAEAVHKLSMDILKQYSKGETFRDNIDEIFKDFNNADLIIGHNVAFDMRYIKAEFSRCNKALGEKKTFCSMLYYTDIVKTPGKNGKYKWPKLEEAVNFMGITNEEADKYTKKFFGTYTGYHDSRFDIASTYLLIKKGIEKGYMEKGYLTERAEYGF